MGYRSEVAVRIEVPSCTTAEKLIEKINIEYVKLEELFDDVVIEKNDTIEIIKLHVNDIKWYHSYTDVSKFETFLDDFEIEIEEREENNDEMDFYNHNGACHFIRIGENYDDLEERCFGNLYDYMGICRYVNWE